MKRKNIYITIALIVVLYIFGITAYFSSTLHNSLMRNRESKYISKEPITVGNRILIVVPHPDDEVLGTGGFIYDQLQKGKEIKVVLMTNGDAFRKAAMEYLKVEQPTPDDFIRLGKVRQKESVSGLKKLGLQDKNIIFLGYGDGSLSHLWDSNWDSANPRKGANGHTSSPYDNSFTKNTSYTGEDVAADLTKIIDGYKPTDIIYPDPDEAHPDHWATSNFVKFTVEKTKCKARLYTYLVHHYQWPDPTLYVPKSGLYPPVSLSTVGTYWHEYGLDSDTVKIKHQALLKYRSQYMAMSGFLDSFIRKNELFGIYGDKHYTVSSHKPDLTQKDISQYTVLYSGVNDNPILRADGSDDIKSLGLYCDKSNYYFIIQTRSSVEKSTTYAVNAVIFNRDGSTGRINMASKGFNVKQSMPTKENIDLGKIEADHFKNRIWFVVPADKIGAPEKIFLNGETYFLNKRIDRTAWRVVIPHSEF